LGDIEHSVELFDVAAALLDDRPILRRGLGLANVDIAREPSVRLCGVKPIGRPAF
jgi:hypothetical protein